MRGRLIAFEGCDRCGKTTQALRLAEAIDATEYIQFPARGTPIGAIIDAYLRRGTDLCGVATHLLFCANRWELAPKISALLAEGTNVVLDRYAFSGVAYGCANGLSSEWCRAPESGLWRPDIVVQICLDADECAARSGYGAERYEQEGFQRVVADEFTRLRDVERAAGQLWCCVDGRGSIEEVHTRVLRVVAPALSGAPGPLRRLDWACPAAGDQCCPAKK